MTRNLIANCGVCGTTLRRRGSISFICTSADCKTCYVLENWRGESLFQHMWHEDVLGAARKMRRENPSMTTLELAKAMYKLPISSESFYLCLPEIWRDTDHLKKGNLSAIRMPRDDVAFMTQVAAEWEYFTRGYQKKIAEAEDAADRIALPSSAARVAEEDEDDFDDEDEDIEETIGAAYIENTPPAPTSNRQKGKPVNFLERYKSGAHREVWLDMMSLGEGVREEPIYSEAKLVAEETMKRVRKNAEVLYERLSGIKFLNGPKKMMLPAPSKDVVSELDKIEEKIGLLPISMRAFCEHVGSIRFSGSLKKIMGVSCTYPDPLFVDLLLYIWDDFDNWEVDWEDGCDPLIASFAPDKYHKADVSGGSPYGIVVPNPCADGVVFCDQFQDLMFVDYLRMCFKCGGLPQLGLKDKPFADNLSKDLIPF